MAVVRAIFLALLCGSRRTYCLTVGSQQVRALSSLQIGSFEGGADAVSESQVQPGWSNESPAQISSAELRTRFWALFAALGTSPVPLKALRASSRDEDVVGAHIMRAGAVEGTPVGNAIGDSLRPLMFDVAYDCRRVGKATIYLELSFMSPRVRPLRLSMEKSCTGKSRHGVSVGTSSEQLHDVVRNGVSHWSIATASDRIISAERHDFDLTWSLQASAVGSADDSLSQRIAPPRVVITTLTDEPIGAAQSKSRLLAGDKRHSQQGWQRKIAERIALLSTQQRSGTYHLPNTSSSGEQHLRVELRGELSAGGVLTTGHRSTLEVDFDCHGQGTSLVEIEVTPMPAYQPYRPTTMSFVKICGSTVRHGFSMSSIPIAADGSNQPDLVRDGHVVGHLKRVGNVQEGLEVFWSSRWPRLGAPDATRISCGNGSIVNAFLLPAAIDTQLQTGEHSEVFLGHQQISFSCLAAGAAQCDLDFAWKEHTGPPRLSFLKLCGGKRRDLDISSDLSVAPAVLVLGDNLREWEKDTKLTLEPDDVEATFSFKLDHRLLPGEQALRLNPPQLHVVGSDILNAELMGDWLNGALVDADSDHADLQVKFECLHSGTAKVEVTVPVAGDIPFDPVTFAFMKRCSRPFWHQGASAAVGLFMFLFGCSSIALLAGLRKV